MFRTRISFRSLFAAAAMTVLAGCSSCDATTATGLTVLGGAGVAAAAGEPELAGAILEGGAQAITRSAATADPTLPSGGDVDMDDLEPAAPARPSGALPPRRACSGLADCYRAAQEQYEAVGRKGGPEWLQLQKMIDDLRSPPGTPVWTK